MDFLEKRLRSHAHWLEGRPGHRLDLSGKDYAFVSFRGRDLRKAFLCESVLASADFTGARLDGADLSWSDLRGAKLVDVSARGTAFGNADLRGTDLGGGGFVDAGLVRANLADTALNGANLSRADLAGADLRRAGLAGAHLVDAALEGADLREADPDLAFLADLNLADVKAPPSLRRLLLQAVEAEPRLLIVRHDGGWRGAPPMAVQGGHWDERRLVGLCLRGVRFFESVIERCQFTECDFRDATWRECRIVRTVFRRCTLRAAILENSAIERCRFENCDFRDLEAYQVEVDDSRFHGGTLASSRWSLCDLRGSSLRDIDLSSAELLWTGQPEP